MKEERLREMLEYYSNGNSKKDRVQLSSNLLEQMYDTYGPENQKDMQIFRRMARDEIATVLKRCNRRDVSEKDMMALESKMKELSSKFTKNVAIGGRQISRESKTDDSVNQEARQLDYGTLMEMDRAQAKLDERAKFLSDYKKKMNIRQSLDNQVRINEARRAEARAEEVEFAKIMSKQVADYERAQADAKQSALNKAKADKKRQEEVMRGFKAKQQREHDRKKKQDEEELARIKQALLDEKQAAKQKMIAKAREMDQVRKENEEQRAIMQRQQREQWEAEKANQKAYEQKLIEDEKRRQAYFDALSAKMSQKQNAMIQATSAAREQDALQQRRIEEYQQQKIREEHLRAQQKEERRKKEAYDIKKSLDVQLARKREEKEMDDAMAREYGLKAKQAAQKQREMDQRAYSIRQKKEYELRAELRDQIKDHHTREHEASVLTNMSEKERRMNADKFKKLESDQQFSDILNTSTYSQKSSSSKYHVRPHYYA